jgi:hypothetical protein
MGSIASLFSSNPDPLGGKPAGDQSSTFANNLYLLGANQQQQQVAGPTGNANVGAATTSLGAAANYDLGVLSGDRSQILATQAPEISSLLSSYDAQRKAQGELNPRGGGRSAFLNEQPYKELGDVNKLVESARPEAAKNLTQVGEAQSYLGTQEQQVASADVQNSLNFLLGKAGVQLNYDQFNAQQQQALGSAAGGAAAQLLMLAAAG